MTRPAPPLRPDRRTDLGHLLIATGQALLSPNAARVQATLEATACTWYPSKTSSAGPIGTGGPSSPVETIGARPVGREADRAVRALRIQHGLYADAMFLLGELEAADPARVIARCPHGHPLAYKGARCNQRDTEGRRCGMAEDSELYCGNPRCPTREKPVKKLWPRFLIDLQLQADVCDGCRKYAERNNNRARSGTGLKVAG